MRRFLNCTLMLLVLLSATSCREQEAQKSNGDYLLYSTAWVQNAPEYRALCYQTFTLAKLQLDRILETPNEGKPRAIVLDIDETVVSNAPLFAYMALHGRKKGGDWTDWDNMADARPLAGALSFLRYADSMGVAVFYITNRRVKERVSTLENLRKFDFPNADSAHLFLMEEEYNKAPRRQLVARDYDIVLLFGDNLNDFSDVFYYNALGQSPQSVTDSLHAEFGSRFLVLPNPMYGSWLRTLCPDKKKSRAERARRSLKPYK